MGLTVIYLAETLSALGKDADAKKILEAFIAADPEKLNPERIPETYTEQEQARELLKRI